MLSQAFSRKNIILIAIPIMIGNLAQTLITFIDTMFLGRVGEIELGAAMMSGLLYYVFSTLAWGFAVGIQIIIARRFGEQSNEKIGAVFNNGLFVVSLLSVLLFLLLHFTTPWLLPAIIDSPNICREALVFMEYRHYGIIFVCFNFLFRALYIGLSNTKIITYTTILMAVVNILLDYLLIFGYGGFPQMGVAGAAIASVIAEISAFLFFIVYTLVRLPIKKYTIFSFQKPDYQIVSSITKLSFPTMCQRLLSFGIWFVFFLLIEHIGERAIAVSGIVRSIYMLILVPVFAFGATANTLTSRLIGEGNRQEVRHLLHRILKLTLAFILVLIAGCLGFAESLTSLFTNDASLAHAAVPLLYIVCGGAVAMAFSTIFFEAVSGTGNTLAALLLETGVLVIYLAYMILSTVIYAFPIEAVWCCEYVYGILLAIISVIYMKKWEGRKIRAI